jgi:predicted ATPase
MTTGFSSLSVSGYRRLRIVDRLQLGPLNVLIGANGGGKTSILEVMDLLAASAEGVLESTISRAGGIGSMLTADGQTESIELELQRPAGPKCPINYQLRISARGTGYAIPLERLSQQQDPTAINPFKFVDATGTRVHYHDAGALREPNWEYKWTETALSQVPKMYREPEGFREVLANSTEIYHFLDVSSRAPVRLPQSIQPADTPGSNGEDLLSCLYSIRETDRDRFDTINDVLHVAFPTFDRIDLPPAAAGSLTLSWRDRDFVRPIFPHQLSEGTLRFLWLVTLLQSPGLPKVTLIDEPEISLHPEMLRILAELMRDVSQRTQLIVATHSDRFVRFLKPEELLVCDLDDGGGTVIRRASDLDLDAWMADYSLDQLWSMGRLGGRSVARS